MRMFLAAFVFLICLDTASTQAAILIQMQETAGNVVFAYSGSLDVSGVGSPGLSFSFGGITPSGGDISLASPGGTATEIYSAAIATSQIFGSGGRAPGSQFLGDPLSVSSSAITMPRNYVNNSQISGSLTFQGQTFNSLGVDNVSAPYVWTVNGSGDTITLSAVPEPSSIAACFLLIGWFAVRHKRRHRSLGTMVR
ncbi:hypothetical protein Poly51_29890 [Rubripirellula tenax]|uniref:PEP-CTERM protein-sorting domain-containing protein n=2 Tax=Rubripirellula tenax TaxID=2528015 RepID=A0A5C6F6R1_9BACT|nr:hypothetical protein Poly51_29890 [Rubripirellula tenax]